MESIGTFLLLPAVKDDWSEGRIPGISTERLYWRQFPLLAGIEFQFPTSLLGRVRATTTVVVPGLDLLERRRVSVIKAQRES